MYEDIDTPSVFGVVAGWQSEDALDAHLHSGAFGFLLGAVDVLTQTAQVSVTRAMDEYPMDALPAIRRLRHNVAEGDRSYLSEVVMHDVMDSVEGEEALVFGPFELRADGSLRRGEVDPLTPKEAGVLAVLCGAAGRIVLKDEIVERVWAGYPAWDGRLARCVHTLRRRLSSAGDDCIATIYGRGYRVTVPVERVVRPQALPSRLGPRPQRDDVPSRAEFAGRQRPDVSSLKNANTTS